MAPDWFTDFLQAPCQQHSIVSAGARVSYRQWTTDKMLPGLVFVHGHAAHSHWWDFIAPAFMERFNVVALDMTGAGDSAHRDEYTPQGFAQEIVDVITDADLVRPTVVGHSFGGSIVRIAGYLHPEDMAAIVMVDSVISPYRRSREKVAPPRERIRYYPSIEEGMRRFRLRPPQPCENRFILNHIARHSLRADANGYRFKLDQAVFAKMPGDNDLPDALSMVNALKVPTGFIYGANSRFFTPEAIEIVQQCIAPSLLVKIDDAHHHLFLDQPLAFIDSLESLVEQLGDTNQDSAGP